MTVVSVRDLAIATKARLDGATGLAVYETTVTGQPPRDQGNKIRAYAVFHPGGGDSTRNSLDAVPGPLLWSFSVLCVGGDHDYLLGAIDAVRGRLEGFVLTVANTSCGPIQPPPGFQPPPAKPDNDENPSRLWIPLMFQVLAVPA